MNNVLAFITSPLQLINLRQFCFDRGIMPANVTVVVKFSMKATSANALRNELAIDHHAWHSVITFENRNKFFHLKKLVQKLTSTKWQTLVTGELTSWWQNTVAANIEVNERVLVDDGTMTLFDYHAYMVNGADYQKTKKVKSFFLRLNALKPRLERPWPITVFSIFPMASSAHVQCERNSLSSLRPDEASETQRDTLLQERRIFLGQPFVDNGQISESEYLSVVASFAAREEGRCCYFPHRSESCEVLEKIKCIENLVVVSYSQPIERVISNQPGHISCVAGMNSTALFTLNLLYPDVAIFFYPMSVMKTVPIALAERCRIIENSLAIQYNTSRLTIDT